MKPAPGTQIPIWMRLEGKEVEGFLVDISVDGLRVMSKSPGVHQIAEYQAALVSLTLPGCKGEIDVAGEIVTVLCSGKVTHFGVYFDAARAGGRGVVDKRIVEYVMQRQREMLQLLWERKS